MKKIINGKLYDTATASCVADENKSLHDFYRSSEALYRTEKGAWFIHGKSSAGGKYGSSDGRESGPGEGLILLTEKEVLNWSEEADIDEDECSAIADLLAVEKG